MAEDLAPPVVAVVVTSDPGPWLEGCLAALRSQDYAGLSTLVIDAGSSESLAERVAAAAPEVYLHRLEHNDGFGPSANAVRELVEGATFYLFCHDDVTPDPDVVRRMVEEAFRSNAGVVAPKLVSAAEPERLLQVGLGVDRFGAPVRRVQPGELDQSQHDEVREVFAAPGGCTLVRADLFATVQGFDPAITMFGEDVDFCWRARLAGARVVVAPTARVLHLEATASRQRPLPEARALQWRHELRSVLKNYARLRRAVVVAELLVLSLVEVAWFTARGKRWRARLVVDAWRWNLGRRRELRALRRHVARVRLLTDRALRRAMERRTFRVSRSLFRLAEVASRDRVGRGRPRLGAAGGSLRSARVAARAGGRAWVAVALAVAVLLVGSRSLLVGNLPLVGQLLPFPGPGRLLADAFSGFTDAGLQQSGPGSPGMGMIGLVGLVLGGATSLVFKLGLVLCVVLGAIGVGRLVAPAAARPGRVAAVIAYLFLPLAWNDVARGDVRALVLYGASPFLLARLTRLRARPASVAGEVAALGLLLALAGSFAPLAVPLAVVMAFALAGSALVADGSPAMKGGGRGIAVALGAVTVALAVTLPWSITYFQSAGAWGVVAGPLAGSPPSLSEVLRFADGPFGGGPLGWAPLLAALFVLLVGRGKRLELGTRFAFAAVAAFAFAWAAGRGWVGPGGGDLRALLAPAAACVSACIGLGTASLFSDLSRERLGWRHAAAGVCGLAAVAGLLPITAASGGGRFDLPTTGYDTVLSFLPSGTAESGRVLWLGRAAALPLVPWQVAPGLAAGFSSGLPDGTRLFPSPSAGLRRTIDAQVGELESGLTVRVGASLAELGVRYVVVPTATAPVLSGIQSAAAATPPQPLLSGLSLQQDLRRLPSEGGALVFADTAWRPGATLLPRPGGGTPALWRHLATALALALAAGLSLWLVRERRRARLARQHARRSALDGLGDVPPVPAPPPESPAPVAELAGSAAGR